jgi:hypothetical protein
MAVIVRPEIVNESVAELIRARIHEHFAGYLCVLRTAARDAATEGLRPNFKEFFDTFFAVPNAPGGLPYLRPFTKTGSGMSAWNQPNVAGSYAGSSVRENAPFRRVVDITGSGNETRYSLRPNHSAMAFEHLALGRQVPVVPLAVYLYRDYGIEIDGEANVAEVVSVFLYEFGYQDESGRLSADFATLFTDESDVGSTAEMFEEAPA